MDGLIGWLIITKKPLK